MLPLILTIMKLPALKLALGALRGLPFTEKIREKAKAGIVNILVNKGVIPAEKATDINVVNQHVNGWQAFVAQKATVVIALLALIYCVHRGWIPVETIVEIIKGILV